MTTEYLTTRELATLLRIKERKVYDLAASGAVPCSKAMGKLLFPRAEVEAWLAAGQPRPDLRKQQRNGRSNPPQAALPNVMLGSHDPLLEWALRESGSGLAAYFDGSGDGLRRFADGEGLAAGLHLFDPTDQSWNVNVATERFGSSPAVLVEWAKRQRGLIIGRSVDREIGGLADLRGQRGLPGLRFAARQAEAGAQQLFDALADQAGLCKADIQETAVLRSETDAALAVLEDKADASFGLQSLAVQYQLAFVPIIEERYDLLVDRRSWFEPPMQILMNFCASEAFKERASELEGYDIEGLGRVHFNGP
ncbi:MAG: putative molybdopterin biosynthesis protein [Hyphomicrobiaceae bacterium]|jgi:putative molybdopterin biosynthesis protein